MNNNQGMRVSGVSKFILSSPKDCHTSCIICCDGSCTRDSLCNVWSSGDEAHRQKYKTVKPSVAKEKLLKPLQSSFAGFVDAWL